MISVTPEAKCSKPVTGGVMVTFGVLQQRLEALSLFLCTGRSKLFFSGCRVVRLVIPGNG